MIVGILALSLAAPSQAPPAAIGPQAKAPNGIAAVLEARHKHCRSLHIEWDEVTTHPRGSFSKLFGGMVDGPTTIGFAMAPAEDLVVLTNHRLLMDGESWHYSVRGDSYDMAKNKVYLLAEDSVHNPRQTTHCWYYPGAGADKTSFGHIYGRDQDKQSLEAMRMSFISPVALLVLPLDPGLHLDTNALDQLLPEKGTAGGEECDIYTHFQPAFGTTLELWATKRDHRIAKLIDRRGKTPISSTTIEYAPGSGDERQPKGWEIAVGVGEALPVVRHTKATVTTFRVNAPIPESDLEFTFPPGIQVWEVFGKRKSFITTEGGGLRPVEEQAGPPQIFKAPAPR